MKKRVLLGIFIPLFTLSLTCHAVDYFTELFDSNNFDLDGLSLTFTPDGSASYYTANAVAITELPVNTAGHTTVTIAGEDGVVFRTVGNAKQLPFYGTDYERFTIGANGYITFGSLGDTDYNETFDNHFDLPRISAFFDDLQRGNGVVTIDQNLLRVVVTFSGVSELGTPYNSNTFQIEMYFNGTIRLSWLGMDATDGLVGLSRGYSNTPATPSDFVETNLSDFDWDSDLDGLPNTWETEFFGGPTNSTASADFDIDGLSNMDEYIAGTDPTNAASRFQITQQALQLDAEVTQYIIEWSSVTDRVYRIRWDSNLISGDFSNILAENISFPVNAFTTTVENAETRFYKMEVQFAE